MAHKHKIAFYPYDREAEQNCYIKNLKNILSADYCLCSFTHGFSSMHNMLHSAVIFLNWYENELTIEDRVLLLIARFLHKKIIWIFHNVLPHEGETEKGRRNLFFMCRISTDIILLSRASRVELSRIVGGRQKILRKAVYIPHVNYCNNYLPGKRQTTFAVGDAFRFLYFGNVRPYKNLELLIHAFNGFRDKQAELLIVGKPMDAKYAKKVKDLCGDNPQIRLDFQYIPDSRVYDYMQTADVVVLPYNKRSSMNSGAMIAAFSCKKPVIVPDIAMARDYADKEYVYQYHYRAAREHEEKLKEAMLRAYENGRGNNCALGISAYEDVNRYNSEEIVREILLNEVMKKDDSVCKRKKNFDCFTRSYTSAGCR